jgi:iron complex outermembrane receptor protein
MGIEIMNSKFTKLYSAVAIATLLAEVNLATAASEAKSTKKVIEEVVITSQKRAAGMSVQDVPSAITAFNEEMIDDSFSVDLTDIGRMVPNAVLNSVGTFPGYPNFFIRGIGVNGSTRSLDPAVGIIVDGVYLGYPASSLQSTFDRESVEVLRGPQGTLLGRNVTGGAINVRSKRPTGEFGFSGEMTLGNYNQQEFSASVQFPIVEDRVAAKIAVISSNRDGYYEDNNGGTVDLAINPAGMPVTSKSDKSDVDLTIIRPMILFTPSDSLDITFIGEYLRDQGGSAASQNIVNPEAQKQAQTVFGYTPPSDKYKINHDLKGGIDAEVWQLLAEANWDIGHGVITSVTGYRDVEFNSSTDFDGTPFPIFAFPDNEEEQDQFSQELRYASNFSDKYNFVTGLYYFDQEYTVGERRQILGTINVAGVSEIKHSNYSVFGETNINLDSQFTLTLGLRYTQEEKEVSFSPPGSCALDFSNCTSVLKADDDWSNVSPKVAVNYAVNEDAMLYGSWTKGFRSGSFNARAVRAGALGPADEETVESFEAGIKTTFADSRVRFNLAVFQMDYTDIQQFVNNPDVNFGSEQLLFNAADATITGFEAELKAYVTDRFTIDVNVGWVDAEFDSFDNFDVNSDGIVDAGDAKVAKELDFVKVPEWTYNVAASYEAEVADIGSLVFRASYSWMDSYFTDARNDPFLRQDSFGLIDASITYRNTANNIKVSLFGKNLDGEEYFDYAANVASFDSARWGGVPRTYGLRISYDY